MIFICGDNHGHFDHIIQACKEHRPSAIISVGDITETLPYGVNEPAYISLAPVLDLGIQFYWVPGNHDTDSANQYDSLFPACPNTNLHGKVMTLHDPDLGRVRVAGLGGIFRGQIWRPPEPQHYASAEDFARRMGKGNTWRGGLPLKHRSTIFPDVYERLSEMKADLLITHEAPSYHPMGFDEIELLAAAMGVKQSYHGHHHEALDYSRFAARDGFEAFGVGFCGIVAIRGYERKDIEVIVRGKFDDERGRRRQPWGQP